MSGWISKEQERGLLSGLGHPYIRRKHSQVEKEAFQYATWTRFFLACAAGYSAEVSGHRAKRKGGWEGESQVAADSSEEGTF